MQGSLKPRRYLIVIAGPTASGKTTKAIQVAEAFECPIISADARQFYKEIPIGTAAPDAVELAQIKHYLVGHLSIHDQYDAGLFAEESVQLLEQIYLEHNYAVLCGGSGLFIKAVTEGLDALPEVPSEIREQIRALYSEHGLMRLQTELKLRDPEYFERVDIQNPHRLMRALEICIATGKTYSEFRAGNPVPRPFIPVKICLDLPRPQLYDRIDARVDAMMAAGLLEEAWAVYPYRHLPALQTVGYKEIFEYFDGKISLELAVQLIKQRTRNYAKRQLTWFRNTGGYHMVHPQHIDAAYINLLMRKIEHP